MKAENEEICCFGDCSQGRLCPRYRKEETPMTRYDLITAVLIVVACALFVSFGPMVRGWL